MKHDHIFLGEDEDVDAALRNQAVMASRYLTTARN